MKSKLQTWVLVWLLLLPLSVSADIYEQFCAPTKYLLGCSVYDQTGVYDVDMGNGETVKLHLTIGAPSSITIEDSIAMGGTYLFGCQRIKADAFGTATYCDTLTGSTGCDSIVTLNLKVYQPFITEPEFSAIACGDEAYFWARNGKSYTGSGIYTDTLKDVSGAGRDTIVSLNLAVYPIATTPLDTTICVEDSLFFGGKYVMGDGIYYDTLTSLATGCDSIIALHLHTELCGGRFEVNVIEYACLGAEYQGRATSHTVAAPYTEWTDSVRVMVNGHAADSIYHYTITPYMLTLPSHLEENLSAFCGKAMDITVVDDSVKAHIRAIGNAYAPNARVVWQLNDSVWRNLPDTTPIRGGRTTVDVRCTVTTDCGNIDSLFTLPVEVPTPENNPAMDNIEAQSMYGDHLLLVNKLLIDSLYGWNIQPEDVKWYQMAGTQPDLSADDEVHTGLYYTTSGSKFVGNYYARITHVSNVTTDCGGTLRTVVIRCQKASESNVAPMLTPSVVQPAESIRLLNLDAQTVTEIRVYNVNGELQQTYTSAEATEFVFRAAYLVGYYLVDVVTDDTKVTLRYIVK